jgi:hypothetical protein
MRHTDDTAQLEAQAWHAAVHDTAFLRCGVGTSERRFYMSPVAEPGGRLRLPTPTVSEGA